jgi:hypothetical protein
MLEVIDITFTKFFMIGKVPKVRDISKKMDSTIIALF